MPYSKTVPRGEPKGPLHNTSFVGREDELVELIDMVESRTKAIIVSGVAGIGKTTFVKEFISKFVRRREVAWINATSSGLDDIHQNIIEQLYNDKRTKTPSIVVLDDANYLGEKDLYFYLNSIFHSKRTRAVIVITRNPIKIKEAQYINLGPLSLTDTIVFLSTLITKPISGEEFVKLATTINGNPLAMNLVVDFIKKHSVSEVWAFLEGEVYSLQSVTRATGKQLVKLVQPQIVLATDSLIKSLKKSPMDIYKVTPRQFEQIIADLLCDMGWEVELTKETRDGGKDILAYMNTDLGKLLCLVEAKRYSSTRPVGVGLIRTLYGTFCDYQANSAMMVTTSRYSDDAREFQKRHGYHLSLREYTDVVEWIQKYKAK